MLNPSNKNSELINVNESGTAEDFANLIKNPYFRSLENDYVKLVKKLEKIEGVEQEVDLNALPTDERDGFLPFLIGRWFSLVGQSEFIKSLKSIPDFNASQPHEDEPEPDLC